MTTKLITDRDEEARYTLKRQTDARTAITRGLAEYLTGLEAEQAGRTLKLKKVFETYAELEAKADYPAGAVLADESGAYDPAGFTPTAQEVVPASEQKAGPDGFLFTSSALVQTLSLEIWTNDDKARSLMAGAVEDAMSPVDWMSGCRLELGHYFGMRGEYLLERVLYPDDEGMAEKRYRRVIFTVRAEVQVARVLRRGRTKVAARVSTFDPEDSEAPTAGAATVAG